MNTIQTSNNFNAYKYKTDIKQTKNENTNFDNLLSSIRSGKNQNEQLKKAASAMESLFVKMMYKSMKQTVEKSGLLDGGQAEDIFDDMLGDELSVQFSGQGRFGLAEMIYNELSSSSSSNILDRKA